jgi:hypothetical protein
MYTIIALERLTLSMGSQTHWVNLAFKWIYLAFLALQFVLALGNRPKGERTAYAITLWFVKVSLYPTQADLCTGFTPSWPFTFSCVRSG